MITQKAISEKKIWGSFCVHIGKGVSEKSTPNFELNVL
jgi:hypothetical protein